MPEIILPGTYITVRDEGLISAGRIATGNIGIVGTAAQGETNKVFSFGSFTEAKQTFGSSTTDTTLVEALKLIFNNGGRTVYAVRAAGDTTADYEAGLALLETELVNIVLLAGQDVSNAEMTTALQGHLATTAENKRERIGVIGCGADTDVDAVAKHGLNSERLVFVAPGVSDKKTGAYTAAAVAGLLSSLPVQTSPTNKVLNLTGLAVKYNNSQLEKLVNSYVLAVENRNGFRLVKGITTAENRAWHQITTRRIVDYAMYGVRSACDPYIGKLNNDRVRGAMKATLDGFLTRMVGAEALVGYTLEVSATRSQEIEGSVMVNMTLQPTFSIDFIHVTMYLG